MSKRKALETLLLGKENFESYIDDTLAHKLTEKEWNKICDSLENSVGRYLDNELSYMVDDYKQQKGIE